MSSPNKKMKITLGSFDLIKGMGMIAIVTGHSMAKYSTGHISAPYPLLVIAGLLSGIMPMFFILVGYSFKDRPIKKMLKKTFKDLMKPYFIVMAFIAVLFPVVHFILYRWWPGAIYATAQYVVAFLLGLPKPGKTVFGLFLYDAMVVWFFLSMFIAMNILNCIVKIENKYYRKLSVIVITIIGYVLARLDFTYFCIPQGMLGAGFCYTGYLIKKYDFFEKSNYRAWFLIVVVALIQSAFGEFGLAYSVYTLGYFSYVGVACSGIVLMYIGLLIRDITFPLSSIIRKIGFYSYWIMCIHSVELTSFPWYVLPQALDLPQNAIIAIELSLKIAIISICCIAIKKLITLKYKRRLVINAK